MVKKTFYTFDSTTDTGVDKVPLNNVMFIEDSDGAGTPKFIMLLDKTSVTSASTVADFLALTSQWTEASILPTDYGTETKGGTAKYKLVGTVLYTTTDGTTPGA